jgi:nitrogen fixation-related uncharacterized protein
MSAHFAEFCWAHPVIVLVFVALLAASVIVLAVFWGAELDQRERERIARDVERIRRRDERRNGVPLSERKLSR